jgi:hypothetical protein
MSDFFDAMDKLAAEIAKAACNSDEADAVVVPLGDKIDAFKALTPFYAFQMKHKGEEDPEDDLLPTFDNFQKNIHATEQANGTDEPGLRGRRRNGN